MIMQLSMMRNTPKPNLLKQVKHPQKKQKAKKKKVDMKTLQKKRNKS